MAQDRALPRDVWDGNPENFSEGGIDNVDVEIVKARFAPDHFPKKTKHFCFFRVNYRTLEDEPQDFTRTYRMGFLNNCLPTNSSPDLPKDEMEPAGGDDSVYKQLADGLVQLEDNEIEDYEGVYIMGVPDKRDDFFVWLRALVDCGFTTNGGDSRQFEGLQVHLDQGKGSSYKDRDSGEEKHSTILLPAAILGNSNKAAAKGKTSTTTTTTTKAAAKPAASAATSKAKSNGASGASLDAVAEAIKEIIANDGDDGSISKGIAIVKLVKKEQYKSLNAVDRKAATDAFNDDSLFTAARGIVYDPSDDMITAV
jgi:hypothetical protein